MTQQKGKSIEYQRPLRGVARTIETLRREISLRAERAVDQATDLLPKPVRKVLDDAVTRGRAIAADTNNAVSSLNAQLGTGMRDLRSRKGRKKLTTQFERQARRVVQRPFRWFEIAASSDVAALRKRLTTIERQLAALDKEPRKAPGNNRKGQAQKPAGVAA